MNEGLTKYKITIDPDYAEGDEDLGLDMIAFVKTPAIQVKGMAFTSHQPYRFKDDIKMRIAAPALIPMDIYRNDEMGEYYVQFTTDEIERIFVKFMSQLNNRDKFNLEHDENKISPAFILEAWLVGKDPQRDRSCQSKRVISFLASMELQWRPWCFLSNGLSIPLRGRHPHEVF